MAWTYLDSGYLENQTDYIQDENWGARKKREECLTTTARIEVYFGKVVPETVLGQPTERTEVS